MATAKLHRKESDGAQYRVFSRLRPVSMSALAKMTGVAREGVIELERPEVGFGSRQWKMISLVAGFRQTLNLIATVSTQRVESRQSLAFLLVADGLGRSQSHIQLVVSERSR